MLCIIVQYISETSAIHTRSHEQSPGLGAALVWTHGPRTRQCAFAINAHTSSRFSIILQSGSHEHATIDRPPVILQYLDVLEGLNLNVLVLEKPRTCSTCSREISRNIILLIIVSCIYILYLYYIRFINKKNFSFVYSLFFFISQDFQYFQFSS